MLAVQTDVTALMSQCSLLQGTPYLTAESIWNLTALPQRLAVIGAGSIALEIGQAFSRFGSKVTVVARTRQAAVTISPRYPDVHMC